MYSDDYKSCEETFVTLRIFFDAQPPDYVSEFLKLNPSRVQVKGEEFGKQRKYTSNGWFLSSEGAVTSKDARRHIDYLLDLVLPVKVKIDELQKSSALIDITCYWVSVSCNGGPTLSKQQLKKLADLGVDFWFDFYCSDEVEEV